jgi:hypothetical protein
MFLGPALIWAIFSASAERILGRNPFCTSSNLLLLGVQERAEARGDSDIREVSLDTVAVCSQGLKLVFKLSRREREEMTAYSAAILSVRFSPDPPTMIGVDFWMARGGLNTFFVQYCYSVKLVNPLVNILRQICIASSKPPSLAPRPRT